ncbi:hypothetical protein TWF106_008243 [Orbilia oligospora]|uniref:Uncharacterized protein n=1 Tax=Orbilia oligospora TaxID=2813651 RepID=A0A7C8QK09_ORBOL|nr:hypothetical protein TWF106_008243 [Orbilia oligospora]
MVSELTERIHNLWAMGHLTPPRSNLEHDRKYYVIDTISRVFELLKAWGGDIPPPTPPQPKPRRPIVPLSDEQLANLAGALKISSPDTYPQTEEEYMQEFVDEVSKWGLNADDILRKKN